MIYARLGHLSLVGLAELAVKLTRIGLQALVQNNLKMITRWCELIPRLNQALDTRPIWPYNFSAQQILASFNLRFDLGGRDLDIDIEIRSASLAI